MKYITMLLFVFLSTSTPFLTTLVFASDVFIETERNRGQGMIRKRGNSCVVITPAHVVRDQETIKVYTSNRFIFDAEIDEDFPNQDIAILRLVNAKDVECRNFEPIQRNILNILNKEEEPDGLLRTKTRGGDVTRLQVVVVGNDQSRTIQIKTKRSVEYFQKGLSGSVLYVKNTPVGMLLSVNNDTGELLQLDYIRAVVGWKTDVSQSEPSTSFSYWKIGLAILAVGIIASQQEGGSSSPPCCSLTVTGLPPE